MNSIKVSIKRLLTASMVLGAAMLIASCDGKKKPNDVEYIAVQYEKDQNWSIVDADGKALINEEYSKDATISAIVDGVFWVKDKNGYQLFSVDDPKKPLIDDYFKSATVFTNGFAFVSKDGYSIKVVDTKGKEIKTLPANITEISNVSKEGYVCYYDFSKNLYGLLDEDGDIVLEADYEYLGYFNDGVCLAIKKGNKDYIVIDESGLQLGSISKNYNLARYSFNEGVIPVVPAESERKEVVYLNTKGEKVMTLKKSELNSWSASDDVFNKFEPYNLVNNHIIYCNESYKYGVADKDGEMLIRPKYEYLIPMEDNEYIAYKGDRYGIIDTEDKEILDFDYEEISSITLGGNYIVKKDGLYSIMDKDKNRVGKDEFYNVGSSECDSKISAISSDQIISYLTSNLTADSYDVVKANMKPNQVADAYGVKEPKDFLNDNYISKSVRANDYFKAYHRCYFYSQVCEMQDEEKCEWRDAFVEGVRIECDVENVDKKELLEGIVNALKKKGFTSEEEYAEQSFYEMTGKGEITRVVVIAGYGSGFAIAFVFNNEEKSIEAQEPDNYD